MTVQFRSKTFKSGNSVAVRLPKALDIAAGLDVIIEPNGRGAFSIKPSNDPEVIRAANRKMVEDMRRIGFPDQIQEREPFEAPDRPGL